MSVTMNIYMKWFEGPLKIILINFQVIYSLSRNLSWESTVRASFIYNPHNADSEFSIGWSHFNLMYLNTICTIQISHCRYIGRIWWRGRMPWSDRKLGSTLEAAGTRNFLNCTLPLGTNLLVYKVLLVLTVGKGWQSICLPFFNLSEMRYS
jgi:hypothetical protein